MTVQREPVTARDGFYEYYAQESLSESTLARFASTKALMERVLASRGAAGRRLHVADIGCGAGTQCRMWADDGHTVVGCDLNEGLVELARQRAAEQGREDITFHVASAEALPIPDRSVDVCLAPELLEHVPDWESCLNEFARVLKPGGLLFASTTNVLCPIQQEYQLPLYSWYPGPLKRHFERVSVTTRPALVNHAAYPAVNWFSFYRLRDALAARGFEDSLDRFDCLAFEERGAAFRAVLSVIRALPPVRFMAHVATPYTVIVAARADGDA
jgi:2-polyprenyl-6-hydroxyphenyl methylase/3-demethylubiquinone-9 3-methyltransferase